MKMNNELEAERAAELRGAFADDSEYKFIHTVYAVLAEYAVFGTNSAESMEELKTQFKEWIEP